MSSLSKQVHRIADQLPEDATWDDVRHLVDRHADEDKLEALRAAVQVGIDDLEAGRSQRFESAHAAAEHLRGVARARIDAARSRFLGSAVVAAG